MWLARGKRLLFLCGVLWALPALGALPEKLDIELLQLNDVYQISPVDKGKRGGLARVAAIRKKILAKNPRSVFVVAGDFLSPSLATRFFGGRQMVDTLGAAGVDLVTLGNHELDLGLATLEERIPQSTFKYVCANAVASKSGRPIKGVEPFEMRSFDGVRIGFFGLVTVDTAVSSNAEGVRFNPPVPAAKNAVAALQRRGADAIVAITHLDMDEDKRLAREVPGLALIAGGHEHEPLISSAGGVPILKMGSDARTLGRHTLHFERKGKRWILASIDHELIPVTDADQEDTEVAKLVFSYEGKLNENLGQPVGKTLVPLEARASKVRREESNLGNLVADTYRAATGSDIALVNGGSLRSDTLFPAGELSSKDLVGFLPFGNKVIKIRAKGPLLRRILEKGVAKAEGPEGAFLQVSGLGYEYDLAKPPGARIVSVKVGMEALNDAKDYTIAMSDFLYKGGDGYDFSGAELLLKPEDAKVDADILIEHVRAAKEISPVVEGRIRAR